MVEIYKNDVMHKTNRTLIINDEKLDNWEVYHPSGRHMFTCSGKKATWYVERNLATIFESKKIRFNFIPKGNGFNDDEIFGRSSREFKCVVNGKSTNLQKHHIIPYCYRNNFSYEYKSKNYHDVVLISDTEHSKYERIASLYKDEIANMYAVKTIDELNSEYSSKLREIDHDTKKILYTLNSIFRKHKVIKQNVLLTKLKFISDNTNINFEVLRNFNYIQLYKLYQHIEAIHDQKVNDFKVSDRKYYDHGYQVVQKLDTEDKIREFIILWRKHFIDTMNPKYMPTGWSENFRIKMSGKTIVS